MAADWRRYPTREALQGARDARVVLYVLSPGTFSLHSQGLQSPERESDVPRTEQQVGF